MEVFFDVAGNAELLDIVVDAGCALCDWLKDEYLGLACGTLLGAGAYHCARPTSVALHEENHDADVQRHTSGALAQDDVDGCARGAAGMKGAGFSASDSREARLASISDGEPSDEHPSESEIDAPSVTSSESDGSQNLRPLCPPPDVRTALVPTSHDFESDISADETGSSHPGYHAGPSHGFESDTSADETGSSHTGSHAGHDNVRSGDSGSDFGPGDASPNNHGVGGASVAAAAFLARMREPARKPNLVVVDATSLPQQLRDACAQQLAAAFQVGQDVAERWSSGKEVVYGMVPVGGAIYSSDGHTEYLGVTSERHGHGTEILRVLEDKLRAAGVAVAALVSRLPAVPFWQKAGYTTWAYDGHLPLMQKALG